MLCWFPATIVVLASIWAWLPGVPRLAAFVPAIGLFVGFDYLHSRMLIARGRGTRFVERYPRIDPVDQLWILSATWAILIMWCLGIGLLIAAIPRPAVIATDPSSLSAAADPAAR